MVDLFNQKDLKKLCNPPNNSSGEDNGQITIIGGSQLFHGAPILSLKAASRVVDMVFFASPEASVGKVAEQIKSQLSSFIWVPWDEVGEYIKKSDAVLIGPGFMRYRSEKISDIRKKEECDEECRITREITQEFLTKFPDKKWVIDAGSLQTMEPEWIPENAILTPNKKEYAGLFGDDDPGQITKKHSCTIIVKGPTTHVYTKSEHTEINGGNAGLTKGGTGDVLAGLTCALYAKNPPHLAACAASFMVKKAADGLHQKVGTNYNADDLAETIFLK